MRESVVRELPLPDAEATAGLARQLARALPDTPGGWLILLQGELGAGKSTLARALLRAFGYEGPVPSPTYTLVEPYELAGFVAYHVDLYRIGGEEELQFLGWSDLQDGLLLVEWPERVASLDSRADLLIRLEYEGDGRRAVLEGRSARAAELLRSMLGS